ncbi:MAG: diguanylate cyclase [Pseudomonadota bacterium]|nr:diguanylate cyclase [Pseudomonadota bacterium]
MIDAATKTKMRIAKREMVTGPGKNNLIAAEKRSGFRSFELKGPGALTRKRQTASRAALMGSFFWFFLAGMTVWTRQLGLTDIPMADLSRFMVFAALIVAANYTYFRTDVCLRVPIHFRHVTLFVTMGHALLMMAFGVTDGFTYLTVFTSVMGLLTILAFLGLTHGFTVSFIAGISLSLAFHGAYHFTPHHGLTVPPNIYAVVTATGITLSLVTSVVNGLNRITKYRFVELLRKQHRQTEIIREQNEELDRKALELTRFNESLRQMTMVDGLTQVANRRCFDDTLRREWIRLLRLGDNPQRLSDPEHPPQISLILLDIDYFKAFNDTYGHLAGDDCLRRVAEAIRGATLRLTDLTARYGGEEFAVLLPDTNLDGAEQVARRIFNNINELSIPHADSGVADHITVSMGVAHVSEFKNLQARHLVHLADKALYDAKNQGRNRIIVVSRP